MTDTENKTKDQLLEQEMFGGETDEPDDEDTQILRDAILGIFGLIAIFMAMVFIASLLGN